ncbi:MAG: T9SS type A sorting domain-containing protein, partial [Chitinophagaceae bacterium]
DSYDCTLPIQLISFSATPSQSKVLLQWQTTTETNNNYFTVQRSSNSDNWQDIAIVKGAGNSSIEKKYSSIDNHPLQGISYYRLQQTDFNGSVSYSEVRQVAISKEQVAISIYPNPASKVLHINTESKAMLRIYNVVGKQMATHNLAQGDNSINIEQLSQGVYVAVIETANGVVTRKIVKE